MPKLLTAYRFDKENFFYIGTSSVMKDANDELLLPPDCTTLKPTLQEGYWTKWDGSKWTYVKKPTSCAEAIAEGFSCISNGPNPHNQEVKAILEKLVENEKDKFKTNITEDFIMTIEAIPEKTFDELKDEKIQEVRNKTKAFDNQLENKEMVFKSSLGFLVDGDLKSKGNVEGCIEKLKKEDSATITFMCGDNVPRELTLQDLETIYLEIINNGENLYQQKWKMIAELTEITTKEELEAYEIVFTQTDFSKQ